MSNISIIAAIGENRELGKNNSLIWYLPEDLKFFKSVTMNHPVIMGYNTLLSLPKKLPGRPYIVLTSKNLLDVDYKVVHSIDELLKYIETLDTEVMVIGGASVYKSMLEYASTLYLTEIEASDKDADTYFPEFSKDEWNVETLSSHESPDGIKYKHRKYTR